jgi:hypothetical protein
LLCGLGFEGGNFSGRDRSGPWPPPAGAGHDKTHHSQEQVPRTSQNLGLHLGEGGVRCPWLEAAQEPCVVRGARYARPHGRRTTHHAPIYRCLTGIAMMRVTCAPLRGANVQCPTAECPTEQRLIRKAKRSRRGGHHTVEGQYRERCRRLTLGFAASDASCAPGPRSV